jgi:hypothetical protein
MLKKRVVVHYLVPDLTGRTNNDFSLQFCGNVLYVLQTAKK